MPYRTIKTPEIFGSVTINEIERAALGLVPKTKAGRVRAAASRTGKVIARRGSRRWSIAGESRLSAKKKAVRQLKRRILAKYAK